MFTRMKLVHSVLVVALLGPLPAAGADDPDSLFRDCVYLPVYPSELASTGPHARIRLLSVRGTERPWDEPFRVGDGFRVEVAAPFAGFFYLLQDDPTGPMLVIPSPSQKDNRISANQAHRFPSDGRSFIIGPTTTGHILLVVSPRPIDGIEKMSWADAREYFFSRSHCGVLVVEEHALSYLGARPQGLSGDLRQ